MRCSEMFWRELEAVFMYRVSMYFNRDTSTCQRVPFTKGILKEKIHRCASEYLLQKVKRIENSILDESSVEYLKRKNTKCIIGKKCYFNEKKANVMKEME